MSNLSRVVQLLKKEHDRSSTEIRGIGAALAAFGKTYGKGTGRRKAVRVGSREDRGCPKGALGKGSGKSQGCSCAWQTDALCSRAKEDRCCTKGSMGKSESRKEGGLVLDFADQASLRQDAVDSLGRLLSPSSASSETTTWRAAISFRTRSIASSFCRRIS